MEKKLKKVKKLLGFFLIISLSNASSATVLLTVSDNLVPYLNDDLLDLVRSSSDHEYVSVLEDALDLPSLFDLQKTRPSIWRMNIHSYSGREFVVDKVSRLNNYKSRCSKEMKDLMDGIVNQLPDDLPSGEYLFVLFQVDNMRVPYEIDGQFMRVAIKQQARKFIWSSKASVSVGWAFCCLFRKPREGEVVTPSLFDGVIKRIRRSLSL